MFDDDRKKKIIETTKNWQEENVKIIMAPFGVEVITMTAPMCCVVPSHIAAKRHPFSSPIGPPLHQDPRVQPRHWQKNRHIPPPTYHPGKPAYPNITSTSDCILVGQTAWSTHLCNMIAVSQRLAVINSRVSGAWGRKSTCSLQHISMDG